MKGITRKWQVAAALVLAGALAPLGAQADDHPVKTAGEKIKVMLYGQVDRALLWADDGDKGKLFFVDNKHASTRFGINAKAKVEGGMTAGAKIEAEIQSNSSGDVNQTLEKTSPVTFTERHLDFYLDGGFGKVSLGQGDTASNGTSEVDLSGSTVVGYSDVPLFAGAMIFLDDNSKSIFENPTETDPAKLKTNPKIKDAFNNFDGLSRDDRLRYDSPKFAGFQVSASAVAMKAWDAALRYAADYGGTKVEAAVAYADFGDQNKLVSGQVNGSLSVMTPMGLSLTGAAGQQTLDDPARKDDPMFWYAKLGYKAKLHDAGATVFAVDYAAANDVKKDKDEAMVYGAYLVQNLDAYNTELYLGYRTHSLDRTGKNYADVSGALAGARIKF